MVYIGKKWDSEYTFLFQQKMAKAALFDQTLYTDSELTQHFDHSSP